MTIVAGLDGDCEHVLLPLSQNAKGTLLAIARQAPDSVLRISPFCFENPEGAHEVQGWDLHLPSSTPASMLPLNCCLFDGLSLVECCCEESEVLRLLTQPEDTRARLGEAIHSIMEQVTEAQRATWRRCRPTENGVPSSLCSAFMGRDNQITLCSTPDGSVPLIDSEPWVPELSPEGFVGLYHHWHPTRKRLCLYAVCQAYLPKACLEFADLVRDLGDTCSAYDVMHSEELQWLRQACARNRARLLAKACDAMGLRCPVMLDYCNAHPRERMAVVATESLHHDIQPIGTNKVRVLNYCASTGKAANGILCSMAPWEGVWVFHGTKCHHAPFGAQYGSLMLPTTAPQVHCDAHKAHPTLTFTSPHTTIDRMEVLHLWDHQRAKHPHALSPFIEEGASTTTPPLLSLAMMPSETEAADPEVQAAYKRSIAKRLAAPSAPISSQPTATKSKRYLLFDEQVLHTMSKRGWNRGLGFTPLIPLACGLCEEWWKHKRLTEAQQEGEASHRLGL
jgi:hypothetical protein